MTHPVRPEVSNQIVPAKKSYKNKAGTFTNNDLAKITLTGAAVFLLWGIQTALIATIVNIALTALIPRAVDNEWYKSDRAVAQVTSKVNKKWYYFQILSSLVFGIFWGIGYLSNNPSQAAEMVNQVVQAVSNPWGLLTVVLWSCLVVPISEEIVFRGFLQEKIRDIQAYNTKGNQDISHFKTVRVSLQAIACGLSAYSSNRASNTAICFIKGFYGYTLGNRKEKTKDLWSSTAIGFCTNLGSAFKNLIDYPTPVIEKQKL